MKDLVDHRAEFEDGAVDWDVNVHYPGQHSNQ